MAKYLVQATYSAEGFKGVAKDKASGRKAALQKALASAGPSLTPSTIRLETVASC